MEILKYKVIKSDAQYFKYCDKLEELADRKKKSKEIIDEIELLGLLIKRYDDDHNTFNDVDPIECLKSLMKDHKMKAVNLAALLKVNEGLGSDMLKYKKGLSKETISVLSERFKLNQEAFNRPYKLKNEIDAKLENIRRVRRKKNRGSMNKENLLELLTLQRNFA